MHATIISRDNLDVYMYINGKWLETRKRIKVFNPYNNELIGSVPYSSTREAKSAIEAARKCKEVLDANKRAKVLVDIANCIRKRRKEFAQKITGESGISIKTSLYEVDRSCSSLLIFAQEATKNTWKPLLLDETNGFFVVREPFGVVSIITPFNHPLHQIAWKLGPCIAAGNRCIIMPSKKVPLTAMMLMEIISEQKLPNGMVNMVCGNPRKIALEMVSSHKVDMVSFTGSVSVGEKIMSKIGIKKVLLELGDTSPLIVLDRSNARMAASAAVFGAFGNSGQRCTSIKRIIITAEAADEFVPEFVKLTKKLVVGDPMDPKTDVGTLIDEKSAKYIEKVVERAVKMGASLLCGGKRSGAQYWPTIIDFVDRNDRVVTNEIFGPIAPIIRVNDPDEAIEVANMNPFGLQAGVYTTKKEQAMKFVRNLEFGTVIINDSPGFRANELPFGGVKKSGVGREGAWYSIEEMSRLKAFVLKNK